MQNLHRDLAAFIVHGPGDLAVLCGLTASREFSGERFYPTRPVGRVTARDDQTHIASSPFGKIGRQTVVFVTVLESCVHRAHEDPVLQGGETEVEGGEQMWVITHRHGR